MDEFAKVVGVGMLAVAAIFFFILLSTFIGGFTGWVIGLFYGDTILRIFAQLGVKDITMFDLGIFLGFVGGFLKTKVTHGKVAL